MGIIKCSNLSDELLKLYPDGLVLGRCKAIVGQFGLTINWILPKGTEQMRFRENEEFYITEVRGKMFVISNYFPNPVIDSRHFKAFKRITYHSAL